MARLHTPEDERMSLGQLLALPPAFDLETATDSARAARRWSIESRVGAALWLKILRSLCGL